MMHMSGERFLTIPVFGLIAGWLARQIMQGAKFGIIGELTRPWRIGRTEADSDRAMLFGDSALSTLRAFSCWRLP